MFLHWLKQSHRIRLTAMLTVTVSLALALVFIVVALVAREQALNRRWMELEKNIRQVSRDWNPDEALKDINEDFPGVDVAVFVDGGAVIAISTKKAIPRFIGRKKSEDKITCGLSSGGKTFVGVTSSVETEAGVRQLALVLALLWLPLTALTAAAAWYGGGSILRPIAELVESAGRLSGTTDGEVLITSDGAEIASLATSLNQLIQRVQRAATLQEQFASDAAHELRTPLALLQTRIEVNLQKDRTPEEHVAAQQAMLLQIDRLSTIVGALLNTARQKHPIPQVENFAYAVRNFVAEWTDLSQCPASAIQLDVEECYSTMSEDDIGIILRNLLDNAARHSPENSAIQVRVTCSDGMILLTLRDFGCGLSSEEMTLAFERFYRSGEGRGRQDGGAGIGLAVVKRIVESHQGSVAFEPVEVGALFTLQLPSHDPSTMVASIRPIPPENNP